ncbi:TPA: hypothetical protein HA219_03095 [Candidatus Woesearchaeota archaeon]|nr:hypothetical protein [Candidatus Woesearchaeota archaeon]
MGLFDFGKKEKKKEVSKEKPKENSFESGSEGLIFNAKFQVLTKSKEYAKQISDSYVENIRNSKDQKGHSKYFVLNKNIDKPRKLRKEELKDLPPDTGKDVFISTLDFDIGVQKKTNVFDFCFEYMPFFIEVTEPMNISFSANELSNYLSSIQATIHKIDEGLKTYKLRIEDLVGKHAILTKNMVRMLRNNILLSLKEKSKDIAELSKSVGISEEQLRPFVENMTKDLPNQPKEIKLEKSKYRVIK